MNHFTTEQQTKLKELEFTWNEQDQEWYSDAYEDVKRIYFDEGLSPFAYCLSERVWNDDDQEYEDRLECFKTLEDLIAQNF